MNGYLIGLLTYLDDTFRRPVVYLPEKWGLAKTQCCMVSDVIFGDNEDNAPLPYL